MSNTTICPSCGAPVNGLPVCPRCGTQINYNNTAYQSSPYDFQMQQEAAKQRTANGCAIAGMILGIISVVLCCLSWVDFIIGIVGLSLSVVGLKSFRFKGPAVAGLICSICGILGALVMFFYYGFYA
jgi:hypothetical protein